MSDLIDRQAAIDALGGNEPVGDPSKWDDDDVVKMWERIRIINIINKLPPAQPEQRWIPCSERLPEDYKDVLVYFEYYRYGDYDCMFSTYGIGSYSGEYDSWLVNSETGWHKLHVFAWMPLPEPYGGD